jgi:hypothetical protein
VGFRGYFALARRRRFFVCTHACRRGSGAWRRGGTYYDVLDFHKTHTIGYPALQQQIDLVTALDAWYSEISSIIHGQLPGVGVDKATYRRLRITLKFKMPRRRRLRTVHSSYIDYFCARPDPSYGNSSPIRLSPSSWPVSMVNSSNCLTSILHKD